MRIALVHDYLREYGGAEKVVEALHELFPEAPIFTAYFNPQGVLAEKTKDWDIRTSWIQKIPGAGKLISPFRILAPRAFGSFDLSGFDVVISSSAIYFAKAVKTQPHTLHLAYIHTPPRYLYNLATSFNYKKHWWTKVGAEIMNHFLRLVDFETSQKPDLLIANSENVKQRIEKFYRREAVVIYPPVEVSELRVKSEEFRVKEKRYYLSLSRLWKGKGVDVIVQACAQLGLPLKVAGEGPELENLKRGAGKFVEFLGQVSDEDKIKLYTEAKALIVAAPEEDFGITVVEAMACGTPVIALREGGYLETIVESNPSTSSGR
ncbi:MAG: glycosyltransferase, partial [bacterium]|nr:glycosyltransferase [bacterium]